jgi:L-fuculose-phosphate aldolase
MYLSDREARELICSIGKQMYEKQYVTANDGNMTIRVGKREAIATPTGISKGSLTPDLLLKVDFDGRVLEGGSEPTSEMSMHLGIYRQNDAIQSTCHAHPLHLTALACAGIELDLPTTPPAACIAGRVPVTPYHCSGTVDLARCVAPYVDHYHLVNLGNHGPISWGKTPVEAWYRLEAAESACQLALMLKYTLGRLRPLTQVQLEELARFHHVDIAPEGMLTGAEHTDNQETKTVLFSSL